MRCSASLPRRAEEARYFSRYMLTTFITDIGYLRVAWGDLRVNEVHLRDHAPSADIRQMGRRGTCWRTCPRTLVVVLCSLTTFNVREVHAEQHAHGETRIETRAAFGGVREVHAEQHAHGEGQTSGKIVQSFTSNVKYVLFCENTIK